MISSVTRVHLGNFTLMYQNCARLIPKLGPNPSSRKVFKDILAHEIHNFCRLRHRSDHSIKSFVKDLIYLRNACHQKNYSRQIHNSRLTINPVDLEKQSLFIREQLVPLLISALIWEGKIREKTLEEYYLTQGVKKDEVTCFNSQ